MQIKKLSLALLFSISICSLNFLMGQDWEPIDTPVETNLILFDISFPTGQNEVGYVGAANLTWNAKGTILKSVDRGINWEIIYSSEENGTGITSISFISPTIGYAGNMSGDVMKTEDGGLTWQSTPVDSTQQTGEIVDLEFLDANIGICATLWAGIFRTHDGGKTWSPSTTLVSGVQDLAFGGTDHVFAAASEQRIYRSEDGGENWMLVHTGNGGFAVALGVHFFNKDHGLVTSEEGQVFVTHDGGDSWDDVIVPGQFGLMRGAWVADENNYWATGTPGQIYTSQDGGITWTADSEIDPNPSYYKIKFTQDGTGYVVGSGSTGGTILRRAKGINATKGYQAQNTIIISPNPIIGDILSGFYSTSWSPKKAQIFDLNGKLMQQVKLNPDNESSFAINLKDLNEGIYTLVLISEKGEIIAGKPFVKL